jgi:alkanesulfonate monooxygenase SsuD/methylene tetrahydromethanopterin reductase-like flavin-dependent oxidoreductase (luciferase family)
VTSYEGKQIQVQDLPFNPVPVQKPHPPIWMGGDSPPTMAMVKELCDGWVPWATTTKEHFKRVLGAPDWPRRHIDISRGTSIFVNTNGDAAVAEARSAFEAAVKGRANRQMQDNYPIRTWPETWEEFEASEVIGTPDDCLAQIAEIESWGVTQLRVGFSTLEAQERTANLLLPRLL